MLSAITVSHPPLIARSGRDLRAHDTEVAAIAAVSRLDSMAQGHPLSALGRMLVRLESVASSKIEHLDASATDYARALSGSRANDSATAMVAASTAIVALIESVGPGGRLPVRAILDAHDALMQDDPFESRHRGAFRTMQNWIGGSDHSPRDALYVPPPPAEVANLIDDLLAFVHRDDLPPLTQAAIAHAQFESIHPFTDGNGRIGRALIQVVLRRRGVARDVVVPVASALAADREDYFDRLTRYRDGDAGPIVEGIADAARIAAEACLDLPGVLSALPVEWRAEARPRRGSAADALIDRLPAEPVVSASSIEAALGVSYTAANGAIAALREAGILSPLDERRRDRAFVAHEVLDELTRLETEIRQRAAARS
ncbi:MAG: Fic family protein [Herbiconiux sp.]|nr:Fic family protein [Herbiconiux sp.]